MIKNVSSYSDTSWEVVTNLTIFYVKEKGATDNIKDNKSTTIFKLMHAPTNIKVNNVII
jgi:hypothetical protein